MGIHSEPLIRRAFVLGAGLGTRLGKLTAHRPKPLIPICQKPLITFAFDHLISHGVREFVVNTHHCAEAYSNAFPTANYRDCPIHFRHEPVLLETAGGLKNAADLLGKDPFVVYNGDILCDMPLENALRRHREQQNEVTLILRSGGGPLQVASDGSRVLDIGGRLATTGRNIAAPLFLFTGVYIVEPSFLDRIPPSTKLSVVPVFMEMLHAGEKLGAVVVDEGQWWDLGTRESYLDVHRYFQKEPNWKAPAPWPIWVHPETQVDPSAHLTGATTLAHGAKIGPRAHLEDCVVWEDAVIAGDARLRNCIVTASRHAEGSHSDTDF